jgi:hypothetical protein
MLERDATVTICHSKSVNLNRLLLQADIIITAVGDRSKFILKSEMVKDKAVVIDVGTNRQSGKLVGDVDFESVKEKASWITPVPGGVGPMTIAMLLSNTVTAAQNSVSPIWPAIWIIYFSLISVLFQTILNTYNRIQQISFYGGLKFCHRFIPPFLSSSVLIQPNGQILRRIILPLQFELA